MDSCQPCLEGRHIECQGVTLALRFREQHGPLFDVQLDLAPQPVPCACPCEEAAKTDAPWPTSPG